MRRRGWLYWIPRAVRQRVQGLVPLWRGCIASGGSGFPCRLGCCGELAQLAHVAFELGFAAGLVIGLLFLCQTLVGRCILVAALGQGQLVGRRRSGLGFFNLCLDAARGFPIGCGYRGLGCIAGQLVAELVEIARLGRHDLAGFTHRDGLGRGFVGNGDHGARAQAVDVAADEGLGIGAQDGNQHLVERDAAGPVGAGKAAGRVAGLDAQLAGGGRHFRTRGPGGRLACRRCSGWPAALDRGGRGAGGRGCRYGGYRAGAPGAFRLRQLGIGRDRGCGTARVGRIQQHGVAALQATRGPVGIDDEIHEWIIDRLRCAQLENGRSVRAAHQLDTDVAGRAAIFHALGAEHVGRSHGGAQAVCFGGADLGNGYLRAKRLAQRGLHGDPAQRQGPGVRGGQSHTGDGGSG